MVARLRVIFAFALFFAGTLPMALVQLIALRTGWFSDVEPPCRKTAGFPKWRFHVYGTNSC